MFFLCVLLFLSFFFLLEIFTFEFPFLSCAPAMFTTNAVICDPLVDKGLAGDAHGAVSGHLIKQLADPALLPQVMC